MVVVLIFSFRVIEVIILEMIIQKITHLHFVSEMRSVLTVFRNSFCGSYVYVTTCT